MGMRGWVACPSIVNSVVAFGVGVVFPPFSSPPFSTNILGDRGGLRMQVVNDANDGGGVEDRILRMVMLPKRHYVVALKRSTFQKRGKGFSEYGALIRCVRQDQSAVTVRVHYLTNGECVCPLKLLFNLGLCFVTEM